MTKKFVIIVNSIKDEELTQPKVIIKEHEIDELETIDYICERYFEKVVDEYDLYDSDEVFVYVENN